MAYWNRSLPGHMEIGGDLERMKSNNKDITGQNSTRNYFHCNPSTFLQFESITKFSDIKLKYPRGGACINRRRNSKLTDLTMPRPSARDNNRTNQTQCQLTSCQFCQRPFTWQLHIHKTVTVCSWHHGGPCRCAIWLPPQSFQNMQKQPWRDAPLTPNLV